MLDKDFMKRLRLFTPQGLKFQSQIFNWDFIEGLKNFYILMSIRILR